MSYQIIRCAVATPTLKVADTDFNAKSHIRLIENAIKSQCQLILFPELSITGYSCGDLFFQTLLLEKSLSQIQTICNQFAKSDIIITLGAPFTHYNKLYNCAFIIQSGKIKAIVPKTIIPGNREFYETRWFVSAKENSPIEIEIHGNKTFFGNSLIFDAGDFKLGIEICEELWAPIPNSSQLALMGADIILNPSASNELVGKHAYRSRLIQNQSGACHCGYLYSSCGVHESTTDLVFSGAAIGASNGNIIFESKRFNRNECNHFADIDVEMLRNDRLQNPGFKQNQKIQTAQVVTLQNQTKKNIKLLQPPTAHPFIPSSPHTRSQQCEEVFEIQAAGLAKRLEHIGCKKAVIGISGGLDSTLALLVTIKAFNLLNLDLEGIVAITMPGFGTTGRTYKNSCDLVNGLGAQLREISIKEATLQHFKDISHDPEIHDVTYENSQARERTQILMDSANALGAVVVGTGDLSELALGWTTYNGDHISMYGVNSGVPKTLVSHLVKWVSTLENFKKVKNTLEDIIDTPVSPELIPAHSNGDISQKTEEIVGPYELHDYFLYYMVRWGFKPNKILFYAEQSFHGRYDKEVIKKWLNIFIKRFFSQQFKRSCLPDGPKVGSINLSPRGDWRMPSDSSPTHWLN